MIDEAVTELIPLVGVRAGCRGRSGVSDGLCRSSSTCEVVT